MFAWTSPQIPALPGTGIAPVLFDSSSKTEIASAPDSAAQRANPTGLYVCGITPYDATHMGHAATYVAFDLLVRSLRDAGVELHYVQNVTDIDDPLLERAEAIGMDWQELAHQQTDLFRSDMAQLRVIAPDHYIGAVESIPQVVVAVEKLLESGVAYRVPVGDDEQVPSPELGDVYLDVSQDPRFGTVSNYSNAQKLEFFAERGGDPERSGKRNQLDPLLWRRERVGEPAWDGASLGNGRPGWHIECAIIAHEHLDAPFDIQGGGSDLLFPHHEMSTNHVRMLHGADAAPRIHSHGGMMAYEGEKMSKSLGNLVLVSKLRADGVDPMAIRLALLAGHYRFDREWTPELLEQSQERLARWREAAELDAAPDAQPLLASVREALSRDLDSPAALVAVDEWVDNALQGEGQDEQAPALLRALVDALLGVEL